MIFYDFSLSESQSSSLKIRGHDSSCTCMCMYICISLDFSWLWYFFTDVFHEFIFVVNRLSTDISSPKPGGYGRHPCALTSFFLQSLSQHMIIWFYDENALFSGEVLPSFGASSAAIEAVCLVHVHIPKVWPTKSATQRPNANCKLRGWNADHPCVLLLSP
jgi:hypothetical protein